MVQQCSNTRIAGSNPALGIICPRLVFYPMYVSLEFHHEIGKGWGGGAATGRWWFSDNRTLNLVHCYPTLLDYTP